MTQRDPSRILENIAHCDDPAKLRRFMKNARRLGEDEVYDAAFQRLIAVQPSAEVDTVVGTVRTVVGTYRIRSTGKGVVSIEEVDESKIPFDCAVDVAGHAESQRGATSTCSNAARVSRLTSWPHRHPLASFRQPAVS